jgi:hypothetical protein
VSASLESERQELDGTAPPPVLPGPHGPSTSCPRGPSLSQSPPAPLAEGPSVEESPVRARLQQLTASPQLASPEVRTRFEEFRTAAELRPSSSPSPSAASSSPPPGLLTSGSLPETPVAEILAEKRAQVPPSMPMPFLIRTPP